MPKRTVQIFYRGPLKDFSKEKSVSYWQTMTGEQRLEAAWEMVRDYYKLKGKNINELRLDRTTALLKRVQS